VIASVNGCARARADHRDAVPTSPWPVTGRRFAPRRHSAASSTRNLAALLPNHVGVALARDMLMTGRRVSAAEARAQGLIARVCAHDDLRPRPSGRAPICSRAGPTLAAEVKRLINSRYGEIDEMTFIRSVASGEVIEGFRASPKAPSPTGFRGVPLRDRL